MSRQGRTKFKLIALVCVSALLLFQSCGDPGFETEKGGLDQLAIMYSKSIGDIVILESPSGIIDLTTGQIAKTGQPVRPLTIAEMTQAQEIFDSLEWCGYDLPPDTNVCMALAIPDHIFTLNDGTTIELPAHSICYGKEVCGNSLTGIGELFSGM